MTYLVIKTLHIIFMVSYFAGIFYTVRLFVYYKDTDAFAEIKRDILRKQYVFMVSRLWNIINIPAGILMLTFGIIMICMNPALLKMSWFHLKLTVLVVLAVYHYWCWKRVVQLKKLNLSELPHKNISLRQANEIATFILFFVCFVAILKYFILEYWWQLALGFLMLVIIINFLVILVNRKNRK